MIIKGPIAIKIDGLTLHIKNIDIAPADYSVGIHTSEIEGFEISAVYKSGVRLTGSDKKDTIIYYEEYPSEQDRVIKLLEKELYKLEQKSYRAAYKRAKKKGYKGSYKDWAADWT